MRSLVVDRARDAWTTGLRARLRKVSRLPHEEAGRAACYASSLLNVAWIPDDWGEEAPSGRLAADVLQNPLRVQPNPATDRFRITVDGEMTGVHILDATGKVVWSAPGAVSGGLEVEAGSWPVGVYWVVAVRSFVSMWSWALAVVVNAQGHDAHWIFGMGYHMEFVDGDVVMHPGRGCGDASTH
jgi:hypothetical protein